jgi:pyruvate/2-oxoglutarate dehydrogenase complex dihydrolipoamide acyltransferase (E2) component
VELDEIVAVIETDKVKVDIRSPESGVITKFHAQLEDTVEVRFIIQIFYFYPRNIHNQTYTNF